MMLNVISIVGLFTMLALAWSMSSHRRKVNWSLVFKGIALQIILALIFFNSQSWTFDRSFSSFKEFREAVAENPELLLSAERFFANKIGERIRIDENSFSSFAEIVAANQLSRVTDGQIDAAFRTDGVQLTLPRYPNGIVFYGVEQFFDVIKRSVDAGSSFVFQVHADPLDDPPTHPRAILSTFAFGVLPTVVFFAALMSVLYYVGLMQFLIRGMAWLMQRTLGTTGAESMAGAAHVLLGHTEGPLVVKPYVKNMTRSELNALMVGGFSTISGSLMAIFANIGISAGHLLTASIISAPAALVIAKILQPETEEPLSIDKLEHQIERNASNIIEAAANGAADGLKLALNIAAMLIAFLALIALIDLCLAGVGGIFGWDWSLSNLFAVLFWPLAWLMGIEVRDCVLAGDLLGKKMVINEFVAYLGLQEAMQSTAVDQRLSERSQIILTYALCGFSNFGAIGIQLGGIGPLAPDRRGDLASLGLRAMFGGMLACSMTACIAGAFLGVI
ncbi:MAG TPA: nucleoside transporter C-terminal domain-containing protein [Pirellulaceae bacterium]|nr:nucleoside transporter C-terminal domain-containing protein [Pirellulaceae bacterium]